MGKSETSLTVNVTSEHTPLADVEVTVSSAEDRRTTRTGSDGTAIFKGIRPAKYRIDAMHAHYHLDRENSFDKEINVLPGTCAAGRVSLRAEAEVSGLVRDAKGNPAPFVKLQLVAIPEHQAGRSLTERWYDAETAGDGHFQFQEVSPGHYYLGTNVMRYLRTSSLPRTYYAGQRTQEGATPVEVKLGEPTDNLIFVLPDFGFVRKIELCAIDESGALVPGARIADAYEKSGGDFASLGPNLQTDANGCVTARGYAKAAYAVKAILSPPGANLLQSRFSDTFVINPGEQSVRQVFTMRKPKGLPTFTRQ